VLPAAGLLTEERPTDEASAPSPPQVRLPLRPRRPRRLLIATLLVGLPLLGALRIDLAITRSRLDHLVGQDQQAQATLTSSNARLGALRVRKATTQDDQRRARAELRGAEEALTGAGQTSASLTAAVAAAGRYLTTLQSMQSRTRRRADELARSVPTAKRCISDGLQALTGATTGWAGQDAAIRDTCASLSLHTSGSAASSAPRS